MYLRCPSKRFDDGEPGRTASGRPVKPRRRGGIRFSKKQAGVLCYNRSLNLPCRNDAATCRVSQANSFWERSMQFEKQLPGHRSPLALAAHRDTTSTFPSPRFSSSNAAATFAGRSAALRPHVHSCQPIDPGRTEGCREGEGRTEDQPRGRMGGPAGAAREPIPLPQSRKPRSGAAAIAVECVVQSGTPRVDPRAWSASIASLWGELRNARRSHHQARCGKPIQWRVEPRFRSGVLRAE
jgi:hypothetical protein